MGSYIYSCMCVCVCVCGCAGAHIDRERYYAEVYGAIFVVDAADSTRIDEARTVLTEAVSDCRIRGKPLLVFANKQDKEGAMPASEIVEKLGLADAGDEDGGGRLAEQFSVMACTAKMFTEDVACGGQHAAHIDRYGRDRRHGSSMTYVTGKTLESVEDHCVAAAAVVQRIICDAS